MKKIGIFLVLLVVSLATVLAATPKQSSKRSEPVPQAQAVEPSQAPAAVPAVQAPTVNPLTQAALQSGILSCVSRINQVSNFVTANSQSGAVLLSSPVGGPDRTLFSASFELDRGKAGTAYVSAAFAPAQDNGCGAVYETVEYGASSCLDIEKRLFGSLKRIGVVKKDMVLLEVGTLKVFLMPAGENGCVVIKKEIVQ